MEVGDLDHDGLVAALRAAFPAQPELLPAIAHKGPEDTDDVMFEGVARKLRLGYNVGGSNVRGALARLVDREVARHRAAVAADGGGDE